MVRSLEKQIQRLEFKISCQLKTLGTGNTHTRYQKRRHLYSMLFWLNKKQQRLRERNNGRLPIVA